jgi:hypothetical protein
MRTLVILAALVATTGATADSRADRDARALDKALAGRVAGKPIDCISPPLAGGTQVIGNHTLLYQNYGRAVLRNELPDACPGLDDNSIIVTEVHGGQLCRGDLFYTLDRDSRIPGPRCRLGAFVPYEKPKLEH